MNQVLAYAGIISEVTLKAMQGIDKDENPKTYNLLEKKRNDMLQRITVLQEIQEVGVFRADIYAESPDIKIEEDEESKALTINFKEYRNIGSESAPTFSNLADSSIKVKYTMDKYSINMQAIKNAEVILTTYFGGDSIVGESGKFILDESNSEIVSKVAEDTAAYMQKVGKTGLSKTRGYIPLIGDVVSFAMDMVIDGEKDKNNLEIIKEQFDSVKASDIYSMFDCNVNFVEYDTANDKKIKIVSNIGTDTQEIIDRVNSGLDVDVSEKKVLTEPDEVWRIIMKETDDNVEKQKIYNDAIEGGK